MNKAADYTCLLKHAALLPLNCLFASNQNQFFLRLMDPSHSKLCDTFFREKD